MALTARVVEQAKARDRPYKLSDGAGLYLYVAPTGSKSWRANYTRAGKQATKTHGRFPTMSLADARRAHALWRDGGAAQAAPTFEAAMREWLRIKLPTLSNTKHQAQVAATLERFVLPAIGQRALDGIRRSELVEVVRSVQAGEARIETAHRVAGRIGMVFDYAVDAGYVESHPAAGLVRVLQARRVKKPMACIAPDEAGALLGAIGGYPELLTRLGLLLLAHTFLRTGELRQLRWDWRVAGDDVMLLPAEAMKRPAPHVLPLSRQVLALLGQLEALTGERALVLDSPQRPGHAVSENTFLFALYRLGYRGRMTGHGFRALASTVLNERSPFGADVIERQLAHRERDAVRAAYHRAQYLDERRAMMQWWSNWLDSQRR